MSPKTLLSVELTVPAWLVDNLILTVTYRHYRERREAQTLDTPA